MNKKVIIAGVITVAVVGAAIAGWLLLGKNESQDKEDVVYVEPITTLMGIGSGMGYPGRFAGVVESQETWDIPQNAEKKVKDILVEEGTEVAVGTPLFNYDTSTMESELSQAELDLERIVNSISDLEAQIKQLEKDKKEANEEEKLSYTTQIQTAQTDKKKNEYDKKSKSIEIEKLKDNISNSMVKSEIAGVVKAINEKNAADPMTGEAQPFLTIVATGEFRIKGKVNEQNFSAIVQGEPAIIRSRVDDSQTWSGTFGKIDMDNPINNNNSGGMVFSAGMSGSGGQETSSSYSFYVDLESSEGLMLGQHVYIETNEGQQEERLGVWIDEGFICDIDKKPYVWADNGKGRMEKREVVLGQHDDALFQYEIADGLSLEDAIAFPTEGIKEGAKAVVNDGQNSSGMQETQMINEGSVMEGNEGEPLPEEGDVPQDAVPSDASGMDEGQDSPSSVQTQEEKGAKAE